MAILAGTKGLLGTVDSVRHTKRTGRWVPIMPPHTNQAANGATANNAVIIRPFTEADEEVIRRLVPAGFLGNFRQYIYSILYNWRLPLLSALLVPFMAILVLPSRAVPILAHTVIGSLVVFAAWCCFLWWELKKFVQKGLANDLKEIAHKYSGSGFGPGSAFWVAEAGGEIVGCVGLQRHSSDRAELRRLSISKNARRQGIGVKLVRQVVAHAAEQGFKEVFLSTSSGQPAAIALYLREGWRVTKERKNHGLRILHFAIDVTKVD